MNENEINRLAAMGNALRPDWPIASLRTLLSGDQLRNKSRRDMAVALAWVACETETKTPARVIESGPWWHAANIETPERVIRQPPRAHEECGKHPGHYRLACGGCAADRRAVREQAEAEQAERTTTTREEALASMRRDVEAAKGWAEDACQSHTIARCGDSGGTVDTDTGAATKGRQNGAERIEGEA